MISIALGLTNSYLIYQGLRLNKLVFTKAKAQLTGRIGPLKTAPMPVDGHKLIERMDSVAEQRGMRRDISIKWFPGWVACVGVNFSRKGEAFLLIDPKLYEADSEACTAASLHELGHIYRSDGFTHPCLTVGATTGSLVFSYNTWPLTLCHDSFLDMIGSIGCTPAPGFSLMTATLAHYFFSRAQEEQADDFAIHECTNGELMGLRRLFQAFLLKQFLVGSVEQMPWSTHPPMYSRIAKVERALRARGILINAEEQKTGKLQTYLLNCSTRASSSSSSIASSYNSPFHSKS